MTFHTQIYTQPENLDQNQNANLNHSQNQKKIVINEGECLTLFEVFSHNNNSKKDGSISNNTSLFKTEVILHPKASLKHILIHTDQKLEPDSRLFKNIQYHESVNTLSLDIHQHQHSQYQSTIIASGNQLQNLKINSYLTEKEARSDIRILNYGRANQKIFTESTAHHQINNTSSNTLVRGIMDDNAKGSFTGKIIVSKHAAKTLAKLENKNILLSKNAEMNTRPLLEIYNDDVQCAHGATVGFLDADALFYLRARGIPEKIARAMLIKAFMQPALYHIQSDPDLCTLIEDLFHDQ